MLNNSEAQTQEEEENAFANCINDQEESRLKERLQTLYNECKITSMGDRKRFRKPTKNDEKTLQEAIKTVNEILETITLQIQNLTQVDCLLYACILLSIEIASLDKKMIIKHINAPSINKKQQWKHQMRNRIDIIRAEISRLNQINDPNPSNKIRRNSANLRRKYGLNTDKKIL